jgi:hypothetical protein
MDRTAVLTGIFSLATASAALAGDKWEDGVVAPSRVPKRLAAMHSQAQIMRHAIIAASYGRIVLKVASEERADRGHAVATMPG